MSAIEVWLFLHILSVLILVSGAGIATFGGIKMASAATPSTVLTYGGASKIGGLVATIGGTLTLPTGIALGHTGSWDLLEGWLVAAYALWFVAMGLGGMQKAYGKRVAGIALQDLQNGDISSSALTATLAEKAPAIRGNLLHVTTLTFLAIMVFRPGS